MLIAALVVAAALGASSGASAPADGTYNYSITQNGSAIGSSSVTVKRADVGITMHETETLSGLSFVVDETLDPATLAPKSYVATYSKGTGSLTARAIFDHSGATLTFDGTTDTATLPLPSGVKNGYVLEGALMTGFMFLPAQIHAVKATQFAQFIPSKVLQSVGRVDANQNPQRPAGVPTGDVSVSVNSAVSFDEWYDPSTFVLHAVSVPSQSVLIKLSK